MVIMMRVPTQSEGLGTMPGVQREASPSLVYGAGLLIPLGGNPLERSNRSASANEAPVAQVDRVPDYGSGGWGFESLRAHKQHELDPSRSHLLAIVPRRTR